MATRCFLRIEQYEETIALVAIDISINPKNEAYNGAVCLTWIDAAKNCEFGMPNETALGFVRVDDKPELEPVPPGTVW